MNKTWACLFLLVAIPMLTEGTRSVPLDARQETVRERQQRQVAFTIDDLPLAGDVDNLKEMQKVNASILSVMIKHRVPAIGFVNEHNLYAKGQTDARIDVLRKWLDAGMLLGNHSFSHADFHRVSLSEYQDDLIRGEVVTRRLLREKGITKLYFRYTFNHTGDTKEKKEGFQSFLQSRGYEIAPFTIEHEDYIFADAYVKALRKPDSALIRRIRDAYLDYLDTKFDYYEKRSQLLLGYEVKQIFLIHANMINADCLEEMISRLKLRGYSFITLEQALQDKAYSTRDEYVGPAGISWLHRWMIALGRPLDYRDDPDPPKFVYDLYRRK
jgi:peptidoglycan/xylan/chitin deacetylase (PgdA/CDA1 family)